MTIKNYTRVLAATIFSLAFAPCAHASSRTWYVNHDTDISSIQNNVYLSLTTATGIFLDGDNVTIARGLSNTVYELDINQSLVTIGNLLWCGGLSPMQLEPGAISEGTPNFPAVLTIKPTSINVNATYISLGGADSKLILDSSSLAPNTSSVQVLLSDNLGSYNNLGSYTTTFIRSLYPLLLQNSWDNYGHLELHSSVNPLGFSIAVSTSSVHRLRSLTFSGDNLIEGDVSQEIYSKNVIFATSGRVILPPLIMGADSNITLQNDLAIGTVSSIALATPVKGSLSLSGSSTIDLNKYKFNIIKGLNTYSKYAFGYSAFAADTGLVLEAHDAQINTYFDQTLQGGAGDGGRFILDASTQVKINNNMAITLSTNANAAGLSYNLFSGAGTIDVPVANRILGNQSSNTDVTTLVSNKTITFNQPVPGVIYWTYDPNGHVISSHINPVQVIPPPNASPNNPQVPTPNSPSPVIRFTDTSVLPLTNITEAVARLAPSSSGKMATDEANDTAIRDVATRVFKIPEDDAMSSLGVSSGEVDKQYSGVWLSSFIQRARQKDTDSIYGYKIRNYGGTLGTDRMFGENFALGIAWTALNAKVKLSGLKVGDGAKVNTNIFSIYSLHNLPNRWFIQSHASAGQSNVKSEEWRYRADGSLGIAAAEYKSYTHNVQASLGKRIYITPMVDFIPSIGVVYNNVRSDGYAERGDVPTISASKRSGYALDALLNAKLYGRYDYKEYTFKPELTASAQFNITKSNMRVNYTASFLEPVSTEVRQSKSWYSAGVGITMYKGLMEYALDYETQFDKGYLGHVGMFKIRLNF